MSTPAMAGPSVVGVQGLTHPAGDYRCKWFGFKLGGHFFRFVDGDHYLAVLESAQDELLVDTIQFEASGSDPRPAIKKLAAEWARRRGSVRHVR